MAKQVIDLKVITGCVSPDMSYLTTEISKNIVFVILEPRIAALRLLRSSVKNGLRLNEIFNHLLSKCKNKN
jgi:hypothetical protein